MGEPVRLELDREGNLLDSEGTALGKLIAVEVGLEEDDPIKRKGPGKRLDIWDGRLLGPHGVERILAVEVQFADEIEPPRKRPG